MEKNIVVKDKSGKELARIADPYLESLILEGKALPLDGTVIKSKPRQY